jgi:hypothetical protein
MTSNAHKQTNSFYPHSVARILKQGPRNHSIFALLSTFAAIIVFGLVAVQATPAQEGLFRNFRARATLSPSSVSFGSVATGANSTKTITVENTGSVTLKISSVTASGTGFSVSGMSTPATIAAGSSATFTAVFKPSTAGAVSGSISILSNALNSHMSVSLAGTGTTTTTPAPTPTPVLAPSPTSLSFGSVTVNASNSLGVTLTNSGTSSVVISGVTTSGTGFSASSMGNVTVAPNATTTLMVNFNPTTAGAVTGTVSVASNATNSPASVSVSGTGVAAPTTAITVSPASLNFGNQNENTASGSSTVTVTNTGSASVTVSSVQAGAPFVVSGFSGTTTLAANQSLSLGVTFDPTAQATYSESLTVASTAPSSPNTVALSGTGTAPPSGGSGSGVSPTTPPICGIASNTSDLVPSSSSWGSFVPPAVGGTYTDAGGYCPVTRVTNFVGNSASAGCHYYATESPLDISDAYLMLYDCNSGGWFVDAGPTNTAYSIGTTILSESALGGKWSHDSEPTWDRTTPGMFWATINNSIESCTVNNSAKTVSCAINHTFSEYAGYRISFMDETDMTPDGWLVTVGQNTQGGHIDVFLWNPATQTKSPVYTTQCSADLNSANNGCIHKLIATPNDGVVIQFEGSTNPENGNELWESPFAALSPIELNSGGTGSGGQGGTDHFDAGKNSSGIEVANFEDFLNNPGPWGACQDGWRPTTVAMPISGDPECLFDNSTNNPGWHVSWRGYPNTQFVVYSAQANGSAAEKFNNASGYAAPSTSNWNVYDNEVIMILVGSNNNPADIYRLALSHTRGNPGYFWSDPRAAEGYSGNYVVFDSNSAWGATGCGSDGGGDCSDVYIIKIH